MSAAETFFDSNVLLYLLSPDARKADRVEELLASGGVISVQVLNEIASVALRKLRLDMVAIRHILGTIRAVCDVRPLDLETHERALDLVERYRFSVYDGLIVAAALRAGCTTLHTEDLQHAQRIGSLTIANPFI
jgi:predicted nucleic acid-binding protein